MERLPLYQLDQQVFDVIIIGGGAVGCASARQLAARGFKCLLVERRDFASGTSSRSSRMLYSGLGYLAPKYPIWQIPFRPVDMLERLRYTAEVMRCRAELVQQMPNHLTKHTFIYPFRSGDQYPTPLVNLGFKLIEGLDGWKVPLAYQRMTRESATQKIALVSGLNSDIESVGVFEEYMYAWPERICLDTALDAEQHGAVLRNYTEVTQIIQHHDDWQVDLKECAPEAIAKVRVRAKLVINAAGPWVDHIPNAGGDLKKRVIGIKGVNVMIRLPAAYKGQGLEAFSSKGEPFYVFPWRDLHFIGPTESVFRDDPDTVKVEAHEIDYILNEANLLFPDLKLTRNDVQHCWCGVRPTSTINGQHVSLPVRVSENLEKPGIFTVTGATIMLHRYASRLVANAVESRLGTRGEAPTNIIRPDGLCFDDLSRIIRDEHVVRLVDLIRRRLPDGLDPDLGHTRAEELSHLAAKLLGWTESRRLEELAFFKMDTQHTYQQLKIA